MTIAKPKRRVRAIPEFNSYEEEANFWDTHSPLDFPDEFEEVDMTITPPVEIVRVKDRRKTLVDSLARLTDDQRQAIALSMLGLYPDEIAQVMGWSVTEAKKALRVAKQRAKIAV